MISFKIITKLEQHSGTCKCSFCHKKILPLGEFSSSKIDKFRVCQACLIELQEVILNNSFDFSKLEKPSIK